MTKESKQPNNILAIIMLAFLVLGLVGVSILEYQNYKAEEYCQSKGHDTGRYKRYGGPHYSCMDLTKYDIPE